MTNIKATKRALGSSVLALFLCFAMLLGTTFAWFTDSVTSANNIITAGNLDVELEYKKIVNGSTKDWAPVREDKQIFEETTLWEPGHVEVVYLKVSNLGTLSLKYNLSINNVKEVPGVNVAGEPFKLSDHLVFKVVGVDDENGFAAYDTYAEAVAAAGVEKGLTDYNGATTPLEVGGVDYVAVIVYMPETVGNEANYRGDAVPQITLGINLFATQYNSEADSFGPDYDADIDLPIVSTVAELKAALESGKSVKLNNDLVLEDGESIVISANMANTFAMRAVAPSIVIDLNGNTIKGASGKGNGAIIVNEGNAAIINGTVENTVVNGDAVINNKGTLVLDDVTVNGAPMSSESYPEYAIVSTGTLVVEDGTVVVSDRGTLRIKGGETVINGGKFVVTDAAGDRVITMHTIYANGGALTIKDGIFQNNYKGVSGSSVICPAGSTINIYGGTFTDGTADGSNFNNTANIQNYMGYGIPVNVYGGTFDDSSVNKNIAKDHKVTKVGDVYIVTLNTTDVVTNADELKAALAAGQDVLFANDITVAASEGGYNKAGIVVNKGQIVDGNGYTLTVTGAGATWSCAIYLTNGTIKNITVAGAMRGVFTAGQSADLYLDNVTFKDVVYTFNSDDGNTDYTIYISNCDMNGWTSHSDVHKEVVYTNCNFGEGNGYKFCRPYGPTKFVNCTFSAGYTVDTTQTTEITFDNCTWVVTSLSALQNKLNENTVGTTTILLDADIAGDVTVTQKPDVNVVIDGNGKTFAGTITVDGESARYETAGLTIKNVNFDSETSNGLAYINLGNGDNATRYTNNVTVEDCTFKGYGDDEVDGAVAVKSYTGGDLNLTIDGCVVGTGMHSMLQVTNVEEGLKIVDCNVNSKNGVNLNNTPSFEMSGCEFDVRGYAIRVGTSGAATAEQKNFSVVDCTLKSACAESDDAVVIFRGTATNAKLDLTGTTLVGGVEMSGNTASTVIVK